MQYSVINKSECSKYDFGNSLFSPDFFLQDKLTTWQTLVKKSSKTVADYFSHIADIRKEVNQDIICYDLTDGLPKFFDGGAEIANIDSAKKVAQEGDFLISRLRSYLQEMGIVEQRPKEQLFSTEFLVFRQKTNYISSSTLFALCMTESVQTILKRGQYGTEHPRFYDFLLTNLPVPDCLLAVDSAIQETMQKALRTRAMSRDIYQQAQTMLLSEIGLTNWTPKHQMAFIQSYSATKYAERIDAEYYQPKYDEIVKAIKGYSGGHDMLGNLVSLKAEDCEINPRQEYKYIELANIADNGEITGCMIEEGQSLPSRARRKVLAGDVIVSSIEGSLQSIALIQEEYNQALCSTGFHVINSEVFNSETLLVLLKSVVGQMQLKKGCNGTILTAINKYELQKIVLPKISEEVQTQIQKKVIESFDLREQSKYLLGCAKQAVEMAIEQDEQAAIKWLENKTKGAISASALQD